MIQEKANQYIALYGDKFPAYAMPEVQRFFLNAEESKTMAMVAQLKDPTTSIILSILTGTLGIDRIYIGEIGLGVLKLITCGGLGIWWIIDLFVIMDETKKKNMELLARYQ